MKKLLFSIAFLLIVPLAAFSQLIDSTTIYIEDFDKSNSKVTFMPPTEPLQAPWAKTKVLSASKDSSITIKFTNLDVTTTSVETDGIVINKGHKFIYFHFDHICKISMNENAYITILFSENGINYETPTPLLITPGSGTHFGNGTYSETVRTPNGNATSFNDKCYSIWEPNNATVKPTDQWWRHESFNIGDLVHNPNFSRYTHFKIVFNFRNSGFPGALDYAGWFVDNVQVISSLTDLFPPTITLVSPYIRGNVLDDIGPYTITADIRDRYRDTINLASIKFKYKVRHFDGVIDNDVFLSADDMIITRPNDPNPESYHNARCTWIIPEQCFGDTITYEIYAEDTHGNAASLTEWFRPSPRGEGALTLNDGRLIGFHEFPHHFITGVDEPVKIALSNKSMNYMNSLKVAWSQESSGGIVNKGEVIWPEEPGKKMCMDYVDSLYLGTFTPVSGDNIIKVWIVSRNNANDSNHSNDTITYYGYSCDSTLNGSYTMGSPTSDFKTLADFKLKLLYCGVSGPITVNLQPGIYSDFTFIDTLYHGQSAINTITFQSGTGNPADVIIVDNSSGNNNGAITLTKVSHYRFKDLTLRGRQATTSKGVAFFGAGSTNITIEGCVIELSTGSIGSTAIGIGRATAGSNTRDEDITIINNTITGGVYGIFLLGSSLHPNIISEISGNTIKSSIRGIYVSQNWVSKISNNTISQIESSTVAFTGIYLDNIKSLKEVSKNRIQADNATTGIYVNALSDTTITYFANNEINVRFTAANVTAVTNASSVCAGVHILASYNLHFINNSIRVYSTENIVGNTMAVYLASLNVTTVPFNLFRNNMFINECRSTALTNYPFYLTREIAADAMISSDHNTYYSLGNVIGFYKAARMNMQDWIEGVRMDNNSISKLPDFKDKSTSLDLNTYIGFECPRYLNVNDDILGRVRNSLTYIGAYAITEPPINLAAVAIVSPTLQVICPQPTYPITVRIKNAGAETINFANTPATVHLIATGGITLNTPVTLNTGTLPALETREVVISPGVAIPANVAVNFTATVKVAGDTLQKDDTIRDQFILELISLNNSLGFNEFDETFSNNILSPTWKIEQMTPGSAGNWRVEQGAGTVPNISPVFGTGRLSMNLQNIPAGSVSRATMPAISLEGAVNPKLELWFAHDNTGTGTIVRNAGIKVKISTDGGNTFSTLAVENSPNDTLIRVYNAAVTSGWRKYIFDLSDAVPGGSCVFIAIDGYAPVSGANRSPNLNIDRVHLLNVLDNDFAITDLYAYGEFPTQVSMATPIKAKIFNVGAASKTHDVTLTISGANTYSETISNLFLGYQKDTVITFNGTPLTNNGNNTIKVAISSSGDQNPSNNEQIYGLITSNDHIRYADTATSNLVHVGGIAGTKIANRYVVKDDEIIINTIRFYPSHETDAVGKRVIAFVSNQSGDIMAVSDTITITAGMVKTWVEAPLNKFALSNVSTHFYAGIHLIDGGEYIGSQIEAPIRDSAYYTLAGTTYTPQNNGRFMIGAVMEKSITHELAILEVVNPFSRCDLTGNEKIIIKITNNGTQPILPGTVFNYAINGGAISSHTLNDTLKRGEVRNFEFAQRYDMNNNKVNINDTYNLKVWVTKHPNDRYTFNDTISTVVISLGKAEAPTVTTPITTTYSSQTTLTANYPPSITQGVLSWFTKIGPDSSWQLLHQGDHFRTPLIFDTTRFYVSVAPGALTTATIGTGNAANSNTPIILKSNYSRGRILYRQPEIGTVAPISKLALHVRASNLSDTTEIPMKLYIKETEDMTFPTQNLSVNWDNETRDALLIFDGIAKFDTGWVEFLFPEVFNYTGKSIMILTETNYGKSNSSPLTFVMSEAEVSYLSQQYISSATATPGPVFSLSPSQNRYRINARFTFTDIDCNSEKIPIDVHVSNMPTYDVETIKLLHPITACTLDEEFIQVSLLNKLKTSIPAGKILIKATFNDGTSNQTISHIVNEAFEPFELKTVTFGTTFDFKAPTTAITWTYVIATDIIGEGASHIFRDNDTIRGNFIAYQTDYLPNVIDTTGEFTKPFVINVGKNQTDIYDSKDATTPINIRPASSFTTPALFVPKTTYWVQAMTQTTNSRCPTKRVEYIIRTDVPDHDLATQALLSPTNYQYNLMNERLIVKLFNTIAQTIPGNTFKIKADFTGTSSQSVEHTISQPISANDTLDITFTNTALLGSNTVNSFYSYKIYTDPVGIFSTVYRLNDTITGTLKVPALPLLPPPITQDIQYGAEELIAPPINNPHTYFYFYDKDAGGNLLGEGNSFTTKPNYSAENYYYYSGRIESPDFAATLTTATGNSGNSCAFNFAVPQSYGMTLYTAADIGNTEGYTARIDTLYINTHTVSIGEIPTKFYIANDARATLPAGTHNWATLTAAAKLIYAGETDFGSDGEWFKIAIPGGFDYTGNSILLLSEHNCNGEKCVNNGVDPLPLFKYHTVASKVLRRDTATISTGNFNAYSFRWNTKFYLNYTTESQRSPITLKIANRPPCDMEVISIQSPITPNNNYTNSEIVRITLQNHAATSASNITVGYCLDGKAPVIENFSGSISANSTGTHSFSTPIDLSEVYFETKLKVFVSLACDTFTKNDTLEIMLQKPDPCVSRAKDTTGADISNFQFAGIDNGAGTPIFGYILPAGSDGRYTDYTKDVMPAVVVPGQTYQFSITNSFSNAATGSALYKYIFLDVNKDNIFTPDELLFSTPDAVAAPTRTDSSNAYTRGFLTIPQGMIPGKSRLRVITSNINLLADSKIENIACALYTAGETEDYAVDIVLPFEVDLGIAAIEHPSGNICADNKARVKVRVQNHGTEEIIFTEDTPLQIQVDISGILSNVYTENIISGSLKPKEERLYYISDVDLNSVGNYTVKTTLQYAPDQYLINNTIITYARVASSTTLPIPISETFDSYDVGDDRLASIPFWTVNNTPAAFAWGIYSNAFPIPNSPNGPTFDNTVGVPLPGQSSGKFASIGIRGAAYFPATSVASMTTPCMNLHYELEFPKRLSYWEHIFAGDANANIKLYVQVGSGDNFVTLDSVVNKTHSNPGENWLQRIIVLTDFDENARIRFLVSDPEGVINPGIDDIKISYGYPDIGVESITNPMAFDQDELDQDSLGRCVYRNDSLILSATIKNYATTAVTNFDITGTASVGNHVKTITEHVTDTIKPGEVLTYTFKQQLQTPSIYDHCAFDVKVTLPYDDNPKNDVARIIACLRNPEIGIEEPENMHGVILGQNIPNPANFQTYIPFSIPEAGQVTFKIFSVEGQVIHAESKQYDMGKHNFYFDAQSFANGVYFYQMYFNDVTLSKKMVIQK